MKGNINIEKEVMCIERNKLNIVSVDKENMVYVCDDGNEYPLVKLEISNMSHPYYTGKMKLIDTAGRVDKFRNRYAKSTAKKAAKTTEK